MLENRKTGNTVYLNPAGKRLQNLPDFRFTWFDMLCVKVSIITYIADMSTDLLLVILYVRDARYTYAVLTMAFFIFPGVIVQVFSYRWHKLDGHKLSFCLVTSHLLLLAPIHRYICILRVGFRARKSKKIDDYQTLYSDMSDVGMLRMFESLLESAPQLVLQTYIMILTDHDYLLTGISAVFSLLSLAWAIVVYSKCLRQSSNNPKRISYVGMFFQALWRFGMISSRIVMIVLLALMLDGQACICLGVHWFVMLVWLIYQDTDFCETAVEERLFNGVLAFVYVFAFFNVKEGHSRGRMYTYYLVNMIENMTITIIYWFSRSERQENWYDIPALVIIWTGFSIGLFGLVIYYLHFHPKVDSIPSCGEIMKLEFIKKSFFCCCLDETAADNSAAPHDGKHKHRHPPPVALDNNGDVPHTLSSPSSRDKLNVELNTTANEKMLDHNRTREAVVSGGTKLYDRPAHQQTFKPSAASMFIVAGRQRAQCSVPNLVTAAVVPTATNKRGGDVAARNKARLHNNKQDEERSQSGVDLRLDGFVVQKDMNCQSRVQVWLENHIHIMLQPVPGWNTTALDDEPATCEMQRRVVTGKSGKLKKQQCRDSTDKTTVFEATHPEPATTAAAAEKDDKAKEKRKSRVSGDHRRRSKAPAPAGSTDNLELCSNTSKPLVAGERVSVIQKLGASNSFVDHSQVVVVRKVARDDAAADFVTTDDDASDEHRPDDQVSKCSFNRNNVTYHCGVRRLRTASNTEIMKVGAENFV